jgi:hypothetical protein
MMAGNNRFRASLSPAYMIVVILAAPLLSLLTSRPAGATTVVVFHLGTHLVIGVDSLRTPRTLGTTPAQPQFKDCKLFAENRAIFTMSGFAPETAVFYSNATVRQVLRNRTSLAGAADEMMKRMPHQYESWLVLRGAQFVEQVIRKGTGQEAKIAEFTLGAFEDGDVIGISVYFYLPVGHPPTVKARKSWFCSRTSCAGGNITFGGESATILSRVRPFLPKFPPELVGPTPADDVAALVQMEIDSGNPVVGPPISVAEVGPRGVSWPRPGLCNGGVTK